MQKGIILNETYILAFVGDGIVKSFSARCVHSATVGACYKNFEFGITVRDDHNSIDTPNYYLFNLSPESNFEDCVNCNLHIFSSMEQMKKLFSHLSMANLIFP